MPWILLQLEQVAPVTAVLGNTDADIMLRETEVIELGSVRFFIHHIVNPRALTGTLRDRMTRANPSVVIFGHTHQASEDSIEGRLFLNPGYAGKPRFAQPRSVALLHIENRHVASEILPL
jgi:putative phosphoesterase